MTLLRGNKALLCVAALLFLHINISETNNADLSCGNPPPIGLCGSIVLYRNGGSYTAVYSCDAHTAFMATDNTQLVCSNGEWVGIEMPVCLYKETGLPCLSDTVDNDLEEVVQPTSMDSVGNDNAAKYHTCTMPEQISHGGYTVLPETRTLYYAEGSKLTYYCEPGYALSGLVELLTCIQGSWVGGAVPTCKLVTRHCSPPSAIEHGFYDFENRNMLHGDSSYPSGTVVKYFCYQSYTIVGNGASNGYVQTMCENGEWLTPLPMCMKRQKCDEPDSIVNGRWSYVDAIPDIRMQYSIGTHIQYSCDSGYELFGEANVECRSGGIWSTSAPNCLPRGKYCPPPSQIEHGSHLCRMSDCNQFSIETEVQFVCDTGYIIRGASTLSCRRGGVWSGLPPSCELAASPAANSVSSSGSSSSSGSVSTLRPGTITVIIAVACCCIGLMLLLTVVFFLQRRRATSGRCCTSRRTSLSATVAATSPSRYNLPPTYQESSTTNARANHHQMEPHDRSIALQYPPLPSYEQATQRPSVATHITAGRFRVAGGGAPEYRRLPSLSRTRESINSLPESQTSPHPTATVAGGGGGGTAHDNVSLAVSSVDAMTLSDATSASVTIDTMESGASNPSLTASQLGNVGSIASATSDASIIAENAPLIAEDDVTTEIGEEA